VRLAVSRSRSNLISATPDRVRLGPRRILGVGAYSAGLLALHGQIVTTDPVIALVVAWPRRLAVGFSHQFSGDQRAEPDPPDVTLGIAFCSLIPGRRAFSHQTGGTKGLHGIEMHRSWGLFAYSDMFVGHGRLFF